MYDGPSPGGAENGRSIIPEPLLFFGNGSNIPLTATPLYAYMLHPPFPKPSSVAISSTSACVGGKLLVTRAHCFVGDARQAHDFHVGMHCHHDFLDGAHTHSRAPQGTYELDLVACLV